MRRVLLALACVLGVGGRGDAADAERVAMNPSHSYLGRVESVGDGTARVTGLANPRMTLARARRDRHDLAEGYYVGLVAADFAYSTKDARLLRVRVTEVGETEATLEVAPEAAGKVEAGEQIVLFRPPGGTTARLKALPGFATVDDGTKASVLSRGAVNTASGLARSRNNLRQIGLALHNFHDAHGVLPPSVVYGPDGKPWHSWRVLILPFVEETELHARYRFDEPWDGPNNKKLLTEMPEVYQDPVHGSPGDYFTHYAAVTGEHAAFPAEGLTVDAPTEKDLGKAFSAGGARKLSAFVDGLSNTLLVGPVSPDRRIPWMKPEDVEVGEDFEPFGETGFAMPYRTGRGTGGLFLYGDGRAETIASSIDPEMMRRLLTIDDGQVVADVPTLDAERPRSEPPAAQFIEITRTPDGATARLVAGDQE